MVWFTKNVFHDLERLLFFPVAFFDEDRNNTGVLTMKLSDIPEKIRGLAGLALGSIVEAFFTVVGGSIIGLAYGWKLALIGISEAVLHRNDFLRAEPWASQRVFLW
jgi:ABC-type multidrug transport system fused ATPase/permease subunit